MEEKVAAQPAKKPSNKQAVDKTATIESIPVDGGLTNGKVAFDELADAVQDTKPQKKKKARRDQ